MTTFSREVSQKIYELVGEYETEKKLRYPEAGSLSRKTKKSLKYEELFGEPVQYIPAPNFAELIRLLPRIGEKKGIGETDLAVHLGIIGHAFVYALTEEAGMKACEEYLMKLL